MGLSRITGGMQARNVHLGKEQHHQAFMNIDIIIISIIRVKNM